MNCFVYTNKWTLKKGIVLEIQIVWKLTPVQSPRITLLEKCLKTILLFKSDNLISVKIKKSSRLKNVLSNFAILDQTRISSAKRDTVVATFHSRGAEGQQKAPLLSYFFLWSYLLVIIFIIFSIGRTPLLSVSEVKLISEGKSTKSFWITLKKHTYLARDEGLICTNTSASVACSLQISDKIHEFCACSLRIAHLCHLEV